MPEPVLELHELSFVPEGDEVVVKVQRPGILSQIETDLDLLYYLARLLEAVVEEVGLYSPTGIVEEFGDALIGSATNPG